MVGKTISNLRVVFMGTPDFAVASLRALISAKCQISAVVTAPDRPAGRGLQLQMSAVKQLANENNLEILQPEKLKDPHFIEKLQSLQPDVIAVVAFRMLPEVVWSLPPMGTINLHGSLLPQYRGAAPINWALINGEKITGVTTFRLRHEIDSGDLLMQEEVSIGDDETAGELYDRMKILGAKLLVSTLEGLAEGTLQARPQSFTLHALGLSDAQLKRAPKIDSKTCHIDWNRSTAEVYNLIRGLAPAPGAYTEFEGKEMKIFRSHVESSAPTIRAGAYVTDKKTFLKFACQNGFLCADEIQLPGRKRVKTIEFLRGYRFDSPAT